MSFSYHERQRRAQCAVHALNNALQRRAATPADFDAVATRLAHTTGRRWAWPQRWLGNYDANVLLSVAAACGVHARWLDRRRLRELAAEALAASRLCALLLNVRNRGLPLACLRPARHWLALRADAAGTFASIDSRCAQARTLGDTAAALAHLDTLAADASLDLHVIALFYGGDAADSEDESLERAAESVPKRRRRVSVADDAGVVNDDDDDDRDMQSAESV